MMQKYIIINARPVLFSTEIAHAAMAEKNLNVESAGFFVITKDREKHSWKVVCMGESTSLGVRSRPDMDQQIIKAFLRLGE